MPHPLDGLRRQGLRCISHFSRGRNGVKGRLRLADTIARCCLRVYLKTPNVADSEEFLRWARHFFAGILTYFKEK